MLTRMRQFPLNVQADIIIACTVLHNLVGRNHDHDRYFNMPQAEKQHDSDLGDVENNEDPNLHALGERVVGDAIRHAIVKEIWDACVNQQYQQLHFSSDDYHSSLNNASLLIQIKGVNLNHSHKSFKTIVKEILFSICYKYSRNRC